MQAVTRGINVFYNDILRIDFYITKANGEARVQSVSITPNFYSAKCDDYGVADKISCKDFHVYCVEPEDAIHARVTGGGEFF